MQQIEKWGVFEITLTGPAIDTLVDQPSLTATFRQQHRSLTVDGFYDGDGAYRVRFSPDALGEWSYRTASSDVSLDGQCGSFVAVAPTDDNHGPVVVRDRTGLGYADGSFFANIGTTCYAWINQGTALAEQTLATLKDAPFDKIRMCVFPKHYRYNENEPERYAFPLLRRGLSHFAQSTDKELIASWEFDYTRFDTAFFQNLDLRVRQLGELGIQADIIVLHPYDRWGFRCLDENTQTRYLRYLVARLSAYRNVWWSLCNEFDFMPDMDNTDWERVARIIQESDPYQRLRGIHNGIKVYDQSRPWITHVSYQGSPDNTDKLLADFKKPVVVDECCYEGDIPEGWGNIDGKEMVNRFWLAFSSGGYCGHSETLLHGDQVIWWAKGGKLLGETPPRLAFFRRLLEESGDPRPFHPSKAKIHHHRCVSRGDDEIIYYSSIHRPSSVSFELPEGRTYQAELINPWAMTVTPIEGSFCGQCEVPITNPEPGFAIRLKAL